jgi:uncharacterized protein (TIGR03437 family)
VLSDAASGEEKGLGGVKVMFGAIEAYLAFGEIQINVKLPDDAPVSGAVPLQLKIGAVSSRSDVSFSIKAREQAPGPR